MTDELTEAPLPFNEGKSNLRQGREAGVPGGQEGPVEKHGLKNWLKRLFKNRGGGEEREYKWPSVEDQVKEHGGTFDDRLTPEEAHQRVKENIKKHGGQAGKDFTNWQSTDY